MKFPCCSDHLRMAVLGLCVFAANLLALPARADDAQTLLEPTTPWVVEWEKDSCAARGSFGKEATPVVLQLERFAPGAEFQLLIIGNALSGMGKYDWLELKFGTGATMRNVRYLSGKNGMGTPTVFVPAAWLSPRPEGDEGADWTTPAMEKDVESISMSWQKTTLTFKTGPLDKAFAALRDCTDDLLKTWGLDPEQQKSLSRRVRPLSSPAFWGRQSDYPKKQLSKNMAGLVNFRLLVDASGSPVLCRIQRSYSDQQFDEKVCDLIMRDARFAPALDITGAPTSSYYANTVIFVP